MAHRFGISLATVQLWLQRAGERPLAAIDWSDRSSAPHRTRRTGASVEDLIVGLRRELQETSALGEYGAEAIHRDLLIRQPEGSVPSARTIGRILERRGVLDGRRRVRRPAPPPGWYLPDLAARRVELDSFDVVDGLYLRGQPELGILTAISLHGGWPGAWPEFGMRAGRVVEAVTEHWQRAGLPAYAQFDNDTRFIGGHAWPDSIGPVIRLCLSLGVTPVFAPPHEVGFQAAIEAFNGRWQAKVWARTWEPTLASLQIRSDAYVAASLARSVARIEAAPARQPFPHREPRPGAVLGRLVFLRRTSEAGIVSILGHRFPVSPDWPHCLVRGELDIDARRLRFFALRRREPTLQPLLSELPYQPPVRWSR